MSADGRQRPHRSKSVTAIIEPAFHGSSLQHSDQAEPPETEYSLIIYIFLGAVILTVPTGPLGRPTCRWESEMRSLVFASVFVACVGAAHANTLTLSCIDASATSGGSGIPLLIEIDFDKSVAIVRPLNTAWPAKISDNSIIWYDYARNQQYELNRITGHLTIEVTYEDRDGNTQRNYQNYTCFRFTGRKF